jgi:hypothetical protein
MDAFGHEHVFNKTPNLPASIVEIKIFGKIHLLFLNGSHQAFSKVVTKALENLGG